MAALFFIIFTSPEAFPQDNSLLPSIERCNGTEQNRSQIDSCTILITSRATTSLGLAIAYNNRGNAYTSTGKFDLAIADYNRALALNPNFVKALNDRGVAYEKSGAYQRALQDFDAALDLDNKYSYAYVNRGDIYSKKRRVSTRLG